MVLNIYMVCGRRRKFLALKKNLKDVHTANAT
jgi:hypothetical protein